MALTDHDRPYDFRTDGPRPGRRGPIATGPGYVDPDRRNLAWIRLVCEPKLRRALIERATDDGVTLSEVVRRAARRYVGMPE